MTDPISLLDRVTTATERLVTTCRGLTDLDLKAPSLLPGWSRGHVISHVARNADSMVNLLTWADTGVETPQYASAEARDADIRAGAARPVLEQIADIEASARRLRTRALRLSARAWQTMVRGRVGDPFPARDLPWLRWREVDIHHVDLDAGYLPADWPDDFVQRLLSEVVHDFAGRHGVPALRLRSADWEANVGIGVPTSTVTGDPAGIAAWLIGRSPGTDLEARPGGPLPSLPAWR